MGDVKILGGFDEAAAPRGRLEGPDRIQRKFVFAGHGGNLSKGDFFSRLGGK